MSSVLWDRDVASDVHDLRHVHGTDVLVNLLREHEFRLLDIPHLVAASEAVGIRVIRFEIDDVSVPEPWREGSFDALIDDIHGLLESDRTVTLHCRGGLGRAGTVAACLLVREGEESATAIRRVRNARPGAIETRDQERYVHDYSLRRRAGRAERTPT